MSDSLPNILYIACHDLGRCLGCYGRTPLSSPNIDRLADGGILFTNHFCTAPSCSPSRGTLMTGRYPHTNGLMGLVGHSGAGWELPLDETVTPQLLEPMGYETWLFGIQHERHDAATMGYDHVVRRSPGRQSAPEMARAVADMLLSRPSAPFYANFGVYEPHRPFGSAEITQVGHDVYVPPYLPDHPEVRREMTGFSRLVRRLDEGVGIVLDALDRAGLAQNTWVIFTTDHGIDMPRAKATLYDPGIETALIMRWPDRIPRQMVRDELLSGVDLLPTQLDALGVEVPSRIQGRSYWSLLTGGAYDPRDAVFAEKTQHTHYDPIRCIRTERFKYIHNIGALRPIEIPADVEMKTLECVPELYVRRRPMEELYDLVADPLEQTNLCGDRLQGLAPDPAYEGTTEELRRRLRQWMEETDDPLLKGCLPVAGFV